MSGLEHMAHNVIASEGSELSATAKPPITANGAVNGAANGHAHPAAGFWALTLGSIGVVYGDIGTSPLYAFKAAVVAAIGPEGAVTREPVLGILSLILWSLILVVTLKYVLVLLRADNNGEGGTLALMALGQRVTGRLQVTVVFLGIVGAALFFGESPGSAAHAKNWMTGRMKTACLKQRRRLIGGPFSFGGRGRDCACRASAKFHRGTVAAHVP